MLGRSGTLLREGKFAEALTALDAAASGAGEPRVVRQRSAALVQTGAVRRGRGRGGTVCEARRPPVARRVPRELPVTRVSPAHRRGQPDAPCRGIRSDLAILDGAVAGNRDEAVELAYCRGFGLTMDAYRLRRASDEDGAREAFKPAMDHVEPSWPPHEPRGHSRLIELYETLDKELDHR